MVGAGEIASSGVFSFRVTTCFAMFSRFYFVMNILEAFRKDFISFYSIMVGALFFSRYSKCRGTDMQKI